MKMRDIVLIAHNLRSSHNVGSLLRTSEGMGISKVWLTGYTPYPVSNKDSRLPHIANKIDAQIKKTALGAETQQKWEHSETIEEVIDSLRHDSFKIIGLEQTKNSVKLPEFIAPQRLAIIVGREVEGVEPEILKLCDNTVEIPMFGKKESFNVVQAAAIALYAIRFS